MDDADLAAKQQENAERQTLRNRAKNNKARVSFSQCLDCLDPIPTARQQAEPGARLCVPCQTQAEPPLRARRW
ncbi:TraR/DksA C4-type zinc finger protein [Shewanella surugensis]|uniref:TraR/DksA C4-type zinc finger protein n=1 Tax=Shewanella surugensis TaxID=212020 RepID=A0ABT0L762_9GAMM|nr:TraR/DksA C4-type zinc finger protein [Shewanella surugensis]MCL1123528.1 TraR/DksA C4-type zinc finger protein [Shewanella surugensis]